MSSLPTDAREAGTALAREAGAARSPAAIIAALEALAAALGKAVQVEPMKSILKAPGTKRLKL